ncbi:thioredoxin fold domain-containing protein [Sulfurimonas sp.]|uniref:thioredoxin family protein n=1 Tax=Sulfurimonas sp. TaxID=2022749 RepID=UPI00286E6BD8|nr:thioredoxin fold domain-containing protein [Sulfurimonas sp.]
MKKIIFSLIFCFVSLFGVDWQNYEEAKKVQQKSSKIIMIDVVRDNCRYCILMDKLLEDREFSSWIAERFIPVKINMKHDKIDLKLDVKMTPTFYFLDKNQKILKIIPGSWSKEDFKDLTKNIKGE